MNYDYACELHLWLLNEFSMSGNMGLHDCIAQISLLRGYEGSLPMIWTKWFMTKVVVKERVLVWWYEVCGLKSSCKWICCDLMNMLCQV